MEPINACDRPISVTASQRLNGVSPNPNPRSVEVGDILLSSLSCDFNKFNSYAHDALRSLPIASG